MNIKLSCSFTEEGQNCKATAHHSLFLVMSLSKERVGEVYPYLEEEERGLWSESTLLPSLTWDCHPAHGVGKRLGNKCFRFLELMKFISGHTEMSISHSFHTSGNTCVYSNF